MRQGEEYVPGTGALNVQLSAEETYAGTLPAPAPLRACCTQAVVLQQQGWGIACCGSRITKACQAARSSCTWR